MFCIPLWWIHQQQGMQPVGEGLCALLFIESPQKDAKDVATHHPNNFKTILASI
jgi:hypothetical protein